MEWILVGLYIIGAYVASYLCIEQRKEHLAKIEKYGNDAVREYYMQCQWPINFNSECSKTNTIAIALAVKILWPIVYGMTSIWNQIIFIRIEKKYKKD